MAINFVGPLPEDEGFNCIVTMTDKVGADIRLILIRTNITAEEFVAIFFDKWFCENELPKEIISDRDKLFISQFWTALHKLTGVKLKLSIAYHSQTDDSSEHTNKTLIQALRFHMLQNWRDGFGRCHGYGST